MGEHIAGPLQCGTDDLGDVNQIQLQMPDDVARAQSTLSQHIKILRDAGVIEAECDGAAICYMLNRRSLDWLREQLHPLSFLQSGAHGGLYSQAVKIEA